MTIPGLLSRPPEESARLLALSYLDDAAAARPRLEDPEDDEALHDFRVALRRLRSCLRAYKPYLAGGVPNRLSRRLRRLAGSTGAGRDAEVQIEWLRPAGKSLGSYHRLGLAWLLDRLEERNREAQRALRERVARDFADCAGELRRCLSVYRAEVHLGGERRPVFAEATADVLGELAEDLGDRLAGIGGAGDEKPAHRARISAKRVRYLLDPLAGEVPRAAPLVQRLKGLQDILGELHDAHVLETELGEAVAEAAALRARRLFAASLADADGDGDKALRAVRRRNHEPGILVLARLNRQRRDRRFAELDSAWLNGRADDFLAELSDFSEALRSATSADQ